MILIIFMILNTKKGEEGVDADPLIRPIHFVDVSGVRPHFKALTEDEEKLVKGVLTDGVNKRKMDRVIADRELAGVKVTPRLIYESLAPRKCVSSAVIDLYCALLKERELDPDNSGLFKTCYFLTSHFYTQLSRGKGGYNFKGVKNLCSEGMIIEMQDKVETIFVPIHHPHPINHWSLAVIDALEKKFKYFDSMGKYDEKILKTLSRWYIDAAVQMRGKHDFAMVDWTYEQAIEIPLQGNVHDCGVFMLKYIDFLCLRSNPGFPFSQQHMAYFRKRIANDCIKCKVEAWI